VCKERPSAIWLAVADPNQAKYRINPEEKLPRAILTNLNSIPGTIDTIVSERLQMN
jgi:hypothetical protein